MQKMKISGEMIANAKKAESELARDEAKRIGASLPEGHPLKAELERQRSILGGDLSGLPPGHPLLTAIEEAKKRYDDNVEKTSVKPTESKSEIRKAKKIDLEAIKREARRKEDDTADKRRTIVGGVNKGIDSVLKGVADLFKTVAENEEILNIEPIGRAKCARLKRLLFAMERGVAECRIARL